MRGRPTGLATQALLSGGLPLADQTCLEAASTHRDGWMFLEQNLLRQKFLKCFVSGDLNGLAQFSVVNKYSTFCVFTNYAEIVH